MDFVEIEQSPVRRRRRYFKTFAGLRRSLFVLGLLSCAVIILAGCGGFGRETPTRTPVPTFTPTPEGQAPVGGIVAPAAQTEATPTPEAVAVEPPTPVPATPIPTDTPTPLPTPTPTDTPQPTPTPTETPVPTPTPTPDYGFVLESAEKFPTEGLVTGVVRIYLYVYSPAEFALAGYSLAVQHNGAPLPVDQVSTGGLPQQTRSEPGPYTRFSNLSAIFVEAQAGEWVVQLVDEDGVPVGPPAQFELTADETTRELYVRYRVR
jgi:hypothetical protein